MSALDLLTRLRQLDVQLRVDGDRLRYDAPPGVVTPELRETLRRHKDELLDHLRRAAGTAKAPIERVPRSRRLPVSFGQRRLWFLQQLAPDSAFYNMAGAVRLAGALDRAAIEQSLLEIQRRHEVLRTTFEICDGEPMQRIAESVDAVLPVLDLTPVAAEARDEALAAEIQRWSGQPFDLAAGPLFRARLARVREDEHVLMLAFHHIVCDGWSIGVFVRELAELYAALAQGGPSPLPELAVQYADFAAWQRASLDGEALEAQLAYWRKHLTEPPPVLELATDRPRPLTQTYRGALHQFAMTEATADAVDALAIRTGATPFMVLLAAFNVLLFRYTGQGDLIVGSPVGNRTRPELEPLIGFFVNSLPLRVRLRGDLTFLDVVAQVREVCLGAFEHQDVPLEKLVEELRPDRDSRFSPLFQVMFALQTAPAAALELPGLTVSVIEGHSVTARYDLSVSMRRTPDRLVGICEYNTDLFDASTIDRLSTHFARLVESLMAEPAARIDAASLLSASEVSALMAGGAGARGTADVRPLAALFADAAARHANAVAIEDGTTRRTYRQLWDGTSRLAGVLRAAGVGQNVAVGVWLERDAALIETLVGITVAGGAYVPLDPSWPAARAANMLRETEARVVVTRASRVADVPAGPWTVITLEAVADAPAVPVPVVGSADDLAYVLYTSGSTGQPKGVAVPQRAVVRLVCDTDYVSLGPATVMGQAATAAFDAATFEIWGALLHGGRLVVVPTDVALAPAALGTYLQRTGVTTLFLTTALVNQIGQESPAALRSVDTVLFGGEAVEPRWVAPIQAAGAPRRLLHVYGPTENTTFSTWYQTPALPADATTIPIGGPIAASSTYVVDAAGGLAPIGVPGELLVGGVGLAHGYVAAPRLTAERFVPDAFSGVPGARLYRTGDLVRWTAPGVLQFIGRRDGQIKLRGFRIELGEVEAALAGLPDVGAAVVVVRGTGTARRLVGYVAPSPGATLNGRALRDALKCELPAYMVPAAIGVLPALPLNANGKIDRALLPDVEPEGVTATEPASYGGLIGTIATVWREVLGVASVGVEDNFFDLGGHSLLLVRVQAGLETALGRSVPLVTLFQYPTIAALAAHLGGGADAAPAPRVQPVPETTVDDGIAIIGLAGRFPGAPSVEAFWEAVCEGRELIRRFTREELLAAGVPAQLIDDPRYVPARAVLDDVDLFDAGLFGIPPREAALLDPQQRLLLECAWTALEHAGYATRSEDGPAIGVWAGTSVNTYVGQASRRALAEAGALPVLLASDKDFLATRVSYKLHLRGPAVTVQTACSTSLVAVHAACQALRAGECEVAIAGGVSVTVPHGGYVYTPEGVAAPDGHCRPFDAAASGTVPGNGVGVVVLKPLRAALAAGDTVYAVIRGTAINNDGAAKVGFTAPSVAGQAAVVAAAQAAAGVTPETIGYVEGHGTGTALGDPIEVAALRQVFGEGAGPGTCALASVKGHVGHLDAAAGVAGLITAVQALRHETIPPTLHFTAPSPQVALGPFRVPARAEAWPRGATPRRAGVSSFGMGGTNAHAVLEEAPPLLEPAEARTWHVVPVSGQTAGAVAEAAAALAAVLTAPDAPALADAAYTQQVGRAALPVRRVAVGQTAEEIAAALTTAPDHVVAGAPPVVWVFPGQGTQLLRMAQVLDMTEPVFRAELDACAAVAQAALGTDLRAVLYPATEAEAWAAAQLQTTTWTQVALVAVELALAAQWRAWGVRPAAVVGHSVGELAAACVAGVLTREGALRLAAARGTAMAAAPAGGMVAIPAAAATIAPRLGSNLWLAADNRATQCVVAGTDAALAGLLSTLEAEGIRGQRLAAAGPFHSGLMADAVAPITAAAAAESRQDPQVAWVSTVTASVLTADAAQDATYWGRQVVAPVRWREAVRAAAEYVGAPAVWLEVGPGHTLTHLVRGTATVAATVAPLDPADADDGLARGVGALWAAGVTIDWAAYHAGMRRQRVALPTYPFQRQRYWLEPATAAPEPRVADIFEKKPDVASWFYRPIWTQAAPRASRTIDAATRRWLVLGGAHPLASRIIDSLEAQGADPTVVTAGTRCDVNGRTCEIRPDEAADYEALLDRVRPGGELPLEIVHLWAIPSAATASEANGGPGDGAARDFHRLLLLARALSRHGGAAGIRLRVVTRGAHVVIGSERIDALAATLLGPLRTIPAEMPHVACANIDVEWSADADLDVCAARVVDELLAQDDASVIAHRGRHRWVPGFESLPAPDAPDNGLSLRPNGVYLITGGLGGVGLALAEALAECVRARLVLVGRSGLPPREEWSALANGNGHRRIADRVDAVRHLEALGAEVLVARADVASVEQMRAVVEQARARFGRIDGVVHAAGIGGDGVIALKHATDADAVLAPKVAGTLVLDQLFRGEPLDFLVLCSSLTAFLGGAGQVDYCAANAFLDAYAQRRWSEGADRVMSLNWDTWSDAGMALDAEVPADMAWRKAKALSSGITRAEGKDAFLRALALGLPQLAICTKDLDVLSAAMRRRAEPATAAVAAAGAAAVPMTSAHARPALTTSYVPPARDAERTICAAFERALGVAGIGVHDNFFELGGHSLLAVELMAQLNREFGTAVPVAGLYERLTPGSVAELFERHVAGTTATGSPERIERRARGRTARQGIAARRREPRIERGDRS